MLWSNLFQCKIPHIDAQHKAMFEHIERLGTMHGDLARIPETVQFLRTYIKEHFEDEESLHSQTHYPSALEHRRQHQAFAAKIDKIHKEYERSGHSLSILMEMNRIIVDWLKVHIMDSDKKFAVYYHDLPVEKQQEVRLPKRPWIPEAGEDLYREAMGLKADVPVSTPKSTASSRSTLGTLWNDSMLCGIPVIDEQHKALFHQIDLLHDRNNKDRVPDILRFLADYVVKHFNDEESIHLRNQYPEALPHRKLHADFVKTFTELKAKYDKSGGNTTILLEINNAVYDWLKNHVLKADKQFAKYYLARNKGETPS